VRSINIALLWVGKDAAQWRPRQPRDAADAV